MKTLFESIKSSVGIGVRAIVAKEVADMLDFLEKEKYDYTIDHEGSEAKNGYRLIVSAKQSKSKVIFDFLYLKGTELFYNVENTKGEEVYHDNNSFLLEDLSENDILMRIEPSKLFQMFLNSVDKNINRLTKKNPRDLDNPYSELGQAKARKAKYERWIEKIK